MKKLATAFPFPLLARDLREQAARVRTWVLRVAYAVILFGLTFWQLDEVLQFLQSGLSVMTLGTGGAVFDRIVLWQLAGIALVMPMITAGAIASERERNTLHLVLITRLTTRQIVLEKLLSRTLSMVSLVVMSFPLLAFAYSLGGVTTLQLTGSICLLLTTSVLAGAIALIWSAWASSTAAALGGTLITGVPCLLILGACIVPTALSSSISGLWIVTVLMELFLTSLLVLLAQEALIARAAVPSRSLLTEFFSGLDTIFDDLNHALARGIIVRQDSRQLPDERPLEWMTLRTRSLNSTRFRIRMALSLQLLSMPAFLMVWDEVAFAGWWRLSSRMTVCCELGWLLLLMITGTTVPGTLSSQRARQTLDALLTTPMSGADILRQSLAGITQLLTLAALPLITVMVLRVAGSGFAAGAIRHVANELLCLVTFIPLAVWLSVWLGLREVSPLRGILKTTVVLLLLALAPVVIWSHPDSMPSVWKEWRGLVIALMCPPMTVRLVEHTLLPTGFVSVLAGEALLLALLIRRYCMKNADRLLGR